MALLKNPTFWDMFANSGASAKSWASAHLAHIQAHLRRRATYHQVVRELAAYSDRELADIGFARSQIRKIAKEAAGEQ